MGREYVRPALAQVRGAFSGEEPVWTPPVLPGTAAARAMSARVRARWLDPQTRFLSRLFSPAYALDAAGALGSARQDRLVRGSPASGGSSAPRLKPVHSRFTALP